jgi:pyruvate/2-oxoglutarate dehydrogenase complex dihydrolipoamide acyltransferase (E2) component
MPLTHILVDFENTQPAAADVALLRGRNQRLWIFRGPGQRKYDAEFAEALMALGERVGVVRCEKAGRNALDMHIAFQIGRLLAEAGDADGDAPSLGFVVVSRDTDYEPLLQYVRKLGYPARRVISMRSALDAEPAEKATATKAAKTKRAPSAAKVARPAAAKAARKAPAAKVAKEAPAAKAAKEAVAKGAREAAAKVAKETPAARVAKAPAKAVTRGAKASPRAAQPPAATSATDVGPLVEKVIDRLRDHPRNRPTRRDRLESWLASHLRGKLAGDHDVATIIAALDKRGVVAFAGTKVEYPQWT